MARAPVIVYDLLHLFLLCPFSYTPRGISRIDFALANHFFTSTDKEVVGLLPTPMGMRIVDADTVRTGLRHLEELWQETIDPESDQSWIDVRLRLNGEGVPASHPHRSGALSFANGILRLGKQLMLTGISPGRPVRSALPSGAVYVNIGQAGLCVPFLFQWLESRMDVCAVMMMHDVIPLEYPDHVRQLVVAVHRSMVRTIAQYGDGLIVPSRHAGESIAAALSSFGRKDIPTLARHLPLASVFAEGGNAPPELAEHTYFVTCGSIEPRKNHGLLIKVWQRLIARLGDDAPHLVIVGSPAWQGEKILKPLKTDRSLQARIHHASRLSSPALKQLLIGSAGLLMPSFAEGFGLPVLEANALGVPTIASCIGAHREIADDKTILLSPDNIDAWVGAILSQSRGAGRVAHAFDSQNSLADYCRDVEDFVEQCSSGSLRSTTANRGYLSNSLPQQWSL